MIIKLKTKQNKNIILEHYNNCKECEINDNNDKLLNLNEKKIVIKIIGSNFNTNTDKDRDIDTDIDNDNDNDNDNDIDTDTDIDNDIDTDTDIFDLIINKYSNIELINSKDIPNNFLLDKGKINIVCCISSKSIYKNCVFIIE
jgi:hypothetical protein